MKNLEKLQFEEGYFLKKKYWQEEEFREAVEKTSERKKRLEKDEKFSVPQKPEQKILLHLQRIEQIAEKKGKLFQKTSLYPKLIIKPENISNDYLKNIILGKFAESKGYDREKLKEPESKQKIIKLFEKETGKDFETYQAPKEEKKQITEQIIRDQKTSLDRWFEYLTSQEAKHYPNVFRYWAFREMIKLGVLNRKRKSFTKRTLKTVAPFPELNHQALALTLDEVKRKCFDQPSKLQLTENQQKELQKRLETENFGKLYAWNLEYVNSLKFPQERLIVTQGEWKKFSQGSKAQDLTNSIQGFNTGWCIASLGTAKSYLSRSDIWIYFSQDKQGKNTIPRAAIVADKEGVCEVRGIIQTKEVKQHLDDYITPIVEDKLKELPGGNKWQEQMEDMKKLAEIHFKHLQKQSLSKEELIFLYEIDHFIQSTGYGEDPRIEEVRKDRNIRSDISMIFNIPENKISLNKEEALKGGIIFHYGNLDLRDLASAKDLELPKKIRGWINLNGLTSAKYLELSEEVEGCVYLNGLTSTKYLKLPKKVGGCVFLKGLTPDDRDKLRKENPHLYSRILP